MPNKSPTCRAKALRAEQRPYVPIRPHVPNKGPTCRTKALRVEQSPYVPIRPHVPNKGPTCRAKAKILPSFTVMAKFPYERNIIGRDVKQQPHISYISGVDCLNYPKLYFRDISSVFTLGTAEAVNDH